MEYAEFQCHVGKAGLTLKEFAELLRMQPASISNKKGKEVPAHLAVIAFLMGEMNEKKIEFRQGLAALDIAPKKSRGGAGAEGRFTPTNPADSGKKKPSVPRKKPVLTQAIPPKKKHAEEPLAAQNKQPRLPGSFIGIKSRLRKS